MRPMISSEKKYKTRERKPVYKKTESKILVIIKQNKKCTSNLFVGHTFLTLNTTSLTKLGEKIQKSKNIILQNFGEVVIPCVS